MNWQDFIPVALLVGVIILWVFVLPRTGLG